MTEAEWLVCTDPRDLAKFCRGRVEPHRFRWLTLDWGGRIRHIFEDDDSRYFDAFATWMIGTGEHPNQVCPEPEFVPLDRPKHAVACARSCIRWLRLGEAGSASAQAAESLAAYLPMPSETIDFNKSHRGRSAKRRESQNAWENGGREAWWAERDAHGERVRGEFCEQFRCVAGNPFRPVAFDSRWRTETAVALASAIYAERTFDRLPILADALQEAGCDHPDLLAHCRGPGPHVRGCWAVDLVLGKG
jgi:hypothetical protein